VGKSEIIKKGKESGLKGGRVSSMVENRQQANKKTDAKRSTLEKGAKGSYPKGQLRMLKKQP